MMRIEVLGEKASSYAMALGVVVSALVFFYWYVFVGSLEQALWRSVAVLIVAYPFLLTRAVPAVFASGIERARRAGIIFKDRASLENLNQASVVVFNKTGTLTVGKPEITDFIVFDDALPLAEALHLAASLESKSAHPIARAMVEKGKTLARSLATTFEYKEVVGMGVSGIVNGKHLEIGNLSFLEGIAGSVRGQDVGFSRFRNEGKTVVFMFIDKKLAALIALKDALRPFIKDAVAALTRQGKQVALLTGDNKTTAEAFARGLGIYTVYSELPAPDKTRIIATVGSVETRADLSILFGTGVANWEKGEWDIVCASDDILSVASVFAISRRTMLVVKIFIISQFVWYAISLSALILF